MSRTETVIKPAKGFSFPNISELWRFRDLVFLFVKRDFAAQYKQTILGPLWHLVQPLLTIFLLMIIFGRIAKMPTDNVPPVLFYLSGLVIWNYFSTTTIAIASTFTDNAHLFGKVYFPRLIMPITSVASNGIRLLIQFALLLIIGIYFSVKGNGMHLNAGWLLIPLLFVLAALLSLGTGIIAASLTTKYRDLNVIIAFGMQLLMFLTPVAYSMNYISETTYGAWIKWNPLAGIIEIFRSILFGRPADYSMLVYSCMFTLTTLVAGILLFNRVEKNVMDSL